MKQALEINQYLRSSNIINFDHPLVAIKACELAEGCSNDAEITKLCFEFVRDEIRHTGDVGEGITTCSASEVLKHRNAVFLFNMKKSSKGLG